MVHPRQLVFDRIFDGDDVLVSRIDLVQRRVQSGRLAASGRTADQDHPIRLVGHRLPHLERRRGEAEFAHPQAGAALVQDAHHDLLAEHRGQGRDAQVELLVLDRHVDPPVLRESAFGDVQVGHDLDARDDRGLQRLGRRHHVVQQTVDPVAHLHTTAVRLDVNVAGTVADGLADDHVDQPDHRSLFGEGAELLNRELLTLLFRNLDVFCDGLTHRLFQIHAAGVVLADGGHDVLLGGDDGFDFQPSDQPYVIKCYDVQRIRNCQLQLLPGLLNRQDLVPVRQVLGHDLHDVGIDLQRRQLDVWHAPLNGQHFRQLLFRQRALLHQDPAEMTAGAVLHLNRPVQLLPAHHLFVQQNLAQGFRAGARPGARRLRVLGWRRELRSTRWSRDLPLPGRLWARWRRRFGRLWHRPGWFCLRWFSPGRLGPRWLDPWRLDPRRLDPRRLDLRRLYSRRGRRGRGLSYRCRRLAVGWRRRRDWHPRQRVRRFRPRPAW